MFGSSILLSSIICVCPCVRACMRAWVCVCVHMQVCHGAYVEVRGQYLGVGFLLPFYKFWRCTQLSRSPWQVSLSTESSYCHAPPQCFCLYFFIDTAVWIISSSLKVEILDYHIKTCQFIYVDALILDRFSLHRYPFSFGWF